MVIDTGGRPFGGAIMHLAEGEKLYKIYRFIPEKSPGYYLEYRILSKIKTNGKVEMAAYNYRVIEGQVEKGDVTRSEEMSPKQLDDIIRSMAKSLESRSPSKLVVVDLTRYATVEEQVQVLKDLDQAQTQYLD
jgi:hypothetical protein